jgi:hypothetical protein
MNLKSYYLLFIVLTMAGVSKAELLKCDSYAGLNRLHMAVSLDTDSKELTVLFDSGSLSKGYATLSTSSRRPRSYYFLPLTYTEGFELAVDEDGSKFLCLRANECYACR